MSRHSRSIKLAMLPALMIGAGCIMGASCISGPQLQGFAVGESARIIGGMIGLVVQVALRAIIPPTIIV